MAVYIFLYNVVGIRANISKLKANLNDAEFVLISSPYCIEMLSQNNKKSFDAIHKISRNFHQISFNEVEKIILEYLEVYEAQNITLLTNEDSTQVVCAKLREKYGISGCTLDQILPFVDKVVSKNKLCQVVRTPKFIKFDKMKYRNDGENYLNFLIKEIQFPMFAKPIDLVSSIGTYHIPNLAALQKAIQQILSLPYEFEVDQFIEGDLFHCDIIFHNQEIQFFMAGKYAFPLAKFSKGSPMGSIPVADKTLLNSLKSFSKKIIDHMGNFSSAFHIEVFLEKESKELIFLEAAARTPGALVPNIYEIIFNINLEELHYLIQLQPVNKLNIARSLHYAGWLTFPKVKGKLLKINKPDISINNRISSFVQPGDLMEQAESLLDASYPKLEHTFDYLKHHNPLILEKDPS